MSSAIQLRGLGKAYTVGTGIASDPRMRYGSLRDTLANGFRRAFGRRAPGADAPVRTFWALRDISLDVAHGEIIGVIGRNGAGKSTLLKIISRITEPTEGYGEIRGRIGSLLEVGTGFHPELSGRENIFLSGTILGMKRTEVMRNFDAIVDFAGVEGFLDTPVKRYSSGMFMRLAFAVAVHLEPEILVVDEVLAVGDAEFQRKCLDRLRLIGGHGRTILLVSHNMSAIRAICRRGIVLDQGRIVEEGDVNTVADRYLASALALGAGDAMETSRFIAESFSIRSLDGPVVKTFDPVEIEVRVRAKTDVGDPGMGVCILSSDHHRIAGLDFKDFQTVPPLRRGEGATMGFRIEELPLLPGTYYLELQLGDVAEHNLEPTGGLLRFDVVETAVYGGRQIDSSHGYLGLKIEAVFSVD